MNMEKIICNVLVFTIITSVLKGLIIKDEYKQYFQFFCGLIMILIVITPFIDFLSSDNDYYDILQKNIYSLEIKDSIGSIKTADGKMRDVLVRQCESKIEGQIKKMAQKDGVDCKSVDVETKMSDEELLEVRNQIELEKKLRPIMLRGDFYRLQNPYTSNYCAWEMVMKNQSEAFLMCAKRLSEANCEDKRIRLQGLDPDLDYIDTFTGNIYGGDELMYNGITPEFGSYDFATQIFYFRKVEK